MYQTDQKQANAFAKREVIPILQKMIPGYEWRSTEESTDPIVLLLDRNCGIDWLGVNKDIGGVRTLAMRCQKATKQRYETFSIRCDRDSGSQTELAKRLSNLANNQLYPQYTVQAFSSGGWDAPLDRMAVCLSKDLYSLAERLVREGFCTPIYNEDNSHFYAISWEYFGEWDPPIKKFYREVDANAK